MFKFRATDEEFREIESNGFATTSQLGATLSPEEQKLVALFDERKSQRSARHRQFLRNLPMMTFFHW